MEHEVKLLTKIKTLEEQLAENTKKFEESMGKIEDPWSEQIAAAFPTRSGSHDLYAIALKMVGPRHGKGELVALVNWLLVKEKSLQSTINVVLWGKTCECGHTHTKRYCGKHGEGGSVCICDDPKEKE